MCNLNNKDDSTIKLLNLVLFYNGGEGGGGVGYPVFVLRFDPDSKCHNSAHI